MKAKPVRPREQANQDVDEAIAYYLGEGAPAAALGFIDALEQAYLRIGRNPSAGSARYAHELNLPGLRSVQLRIHRWCSTSIGPITLTSGACCTESGTLRPGCARPINQESRGARPERGLRLDAAAHRRAAAHVAIRMRALADDEFVAAAAMRHQFEQVALRPPSKRGDKVSAGAATRDNLPSSAECLRPTTIFEEIVPVRLQVVKIGTVYEAPVLPVGGDDCGGNDWRCRGCGRLG